MQGSERVEKHLQVQSSLVMKSTESLPVLPDSKYGIYCLLGEPNYTSVNSAKSSPNSSVGTEMEFGES